MLILQNFVVFSTIFWRQQRRRQWIIFSCKNHKFCQKNTSFTKLLSFIWGSREIIFLKLTWKFKKFNTQNFGCRGQPPLLTLHGCCCIKYSFNWSALRSFQVQKRILHIFSFHIISLICTVFKLCGPEHLFPNTPRTSSHSHQSLLVTATYSQPLQSHLPTDTKQVLVHLLIAERRKTKRKVRKIMLLPRREGGLE